MSRAGSSLVLLALSACVTTTLDQPPHSAEPVELQTVVVPFAGGSGGGDPIDQYYASVLTQMQQALSERDLQRLGGLLVGTKARQGAPEWASARIERFETARLGLAFEDHAATHSRIEVAEEGHTIGEGIDFVFQLDVPPDHDVVLEDTRRSGLRFLATLSVVDYDPYGGNTTRIASRTLRLTKPLTRHMQHPSEATFNAAADSTVAVVRELVATVELLPGTVQIDNQLAPIQRMRLAERREVLYPAGFEVIREQPLKTLRNAMALGDPKHFPHQYLAARFMPPSDRAQAVELFIQTVRLGNQVQARVAMAGLAFLTGEDIPVGDRDAWLAWWQRR